nr:histidine kinase dimerization/phosphoacceptor domain-containing protein [Kineosporia mesophila]
MLKARAVKAEREREYLYRIALADQRSAIARELHDVVAHSSAVMVIQADGAGYVLPAQAEQARAALKTISSVGREALGDMHNIVDVLRGDTDGLGDSWWQESGYRRVSLDSLEDMAERARAWRSTSRSRGRRMRSRPVRNSRSSGSCRRA